MPTSCLLLSLVCEVTSSRGKSPAPGEQELGAPLPSIPWALCSRIQPTADKSVRREGRTCASTRGPCHCPLKNPA